MSDDTSRERARQVAHELCIRERDDDVLLCAGGHMDGRHSTLCDAVTDALLAFAKAEVAAALKARTALEAELVSAMEKRQ